MKYEAHVFWPQFKIWSMYGLQAPCLISMVVQSKKQKCELNSCTLYSVFPFFSDYVIKYSDLNLSLFAAGSDYHMVDEILTFIPGESKDQCFDVIISDNSFYKDSKEFVLLLLANGDYVSRVLINESTVTVLGSDKRKELDIL